MPKKNCFSALINQDVGRFRRVRHSTTNYFSGRDPFFTKKRAEQLVGQLPNSGANLLTTTGGVIGAAALTGTAAGSAMAATAFAAAVAGPQAAITGAVIGLAMLAKGAYSNRESAHKKLSQYVWNLVDDCPPEKTFSTEGLKDAADAGLYLMSEGASQIKLLGPKLVAAQTKFDVLNRDIEKKILALNRTKKSIQSLIYRGDIPSAFDTMQLWQSDKLEISDWLAGIWDIETQPGGAIFDYVRRCAHVGNYIQAPHVVSLAMKEAVANGSVVGRPQKDYFDGWQTIHNFRGTFTRLDEVFHQFGIVSLSP